MLLVECLSLMSLQINRHSHLDFRFLRINMKIHLTSDLKTALTFFIFGCLWIFLSDYIFLAIVDHDLATYYRIQQVKGVLFILFSSLLIYFVSRELHKDLEVSNARISAANAELSEALERYTMLTMATRDAIRDYNLATGQVYVNNTFHELFGTTINELQSQKDWWEKNMHPQDHDRVLKSLADAMHSKLKIWQEEYLFKSADGSYRKILDRSHILYEQDQAYRIISAMQDVTQHSELLEKLSEQRLSHEKELSQIILSTQESERRSLAAELHDNINQLMTTAKLHIELAKSNPARSSEILEKVEHMMNHIINEVRILSREIAPSGITDLGLADSLMDMAASIEKTGKITIDVNTSSFTEENMNVDKKLTLYRIAQEQLNNIIKHAKATHASIHIYSTNGFVQMEIKDNGVGFNMHMLTPGMGFSNMRKRLEVFNGKMHIVSAPGRGTELVISL